MLVYLLYNPISGGNQASELTKLTTPDINLANINTVVKTRPIQSDDETFTAITTEINNHENIVYVLVAGGDGTILWAFDRLIKHKAKPEKFAIGVIPFGTGNDFSRACNWGGSYLGGIVGGPKFDKLEALVKKYTAGSVEKFDLWEVSIELKSPNEKWSTQPSIIQVKKGVKKVINESGVLTKLCGNYFSTGVESRVGLNFDKKRRKSAILNKAIYAYEGAKKMTVCRTTNVSTLIQSISNTGSDKTFQCPNSYASLVMLNVTSISGGVNLWRLSSNKFFNSDPSITSSPKKGPEQSFMDGKIDVVAVPTLFQFARAQIPVLNSVTYCGHRVCQSDGPLVVKFNETDERVYMQIDGEFYQCHHVDHVCLKHFASVQVLVKK